MFIKYLKLLSSKYFKKHLKQAIQRTLPLKLCVRELNIQLLTKIDITPMSMCMHVCVYICVCV